MAATKRGPGGETGFQGPITPSRDGRAMHPRRGEEGPFRQEVVTGKVLGDLGLHESGFIWPLQYHFPLPSLDLVIFFQCH